MQKSSETEIAILNAAKIIFLRKGMEGARMQEIADEAKINKALLHYYFRSKENLFDAVFEEAIQKLFPQMIKILNSDKDFFDKIRDFFIVHGEFLLENPFMPAFIMHEMQRNPDRIIKRMPDFQSISKGNFMVQCEQEILEGRIKPIKPFHLIFNLLSLSIFPIVSRPLMQATFQISDKNYIDFIKERMLTLGDFVINAIKVS